ncbi:MAG: ATP-dependent DNA ligase [Pseudooceanicola sp.]|jgi:DNA ligase-1|nr:ATP-dependent DNA ligase [Pseudooceanicola sp.]
MKRFAEMVRQVDQTTRTNVKLDALSTYLAEAPDQDRLWTVALFTGRRPRRAVPAARLREWAAERSGLPLWLVEESYAVVGDLAETVALVLPPPMAPEERSLTDWIAFLADLAALDEDAKRAAIESAWDRLDTDERFLFNKLITGGFRIGVSQKLMTRAMARATGRDESDLAHRLMGDWTPESTTWHRLAEADDAGDDASRPYPFYLAHPLEQPPEDLGDPADWQAEWKWDGIRGQLVVRDGQHFTWSRGGELVTPAFPEFARAPDFLPDGTVLDGEILVWSGDTAGHPDSFNALQKRIGRKTVPKTLLNSAPVVLYAYDLLEWQGQDLRAQPLADRRAQLESLFDRLPPDAPLRLAPTVHFIDWSDLAQQRITAREERAEGLMLKRLSSPYQVGRKKGDWWKWKLDPLTVDAVMIYAQSGSGRRANLFTDFTFAVWNGNELVPFTKAYSGLSDTEFRQITNWVRKNTQQKFGPVRQVTPEHVFEIAFEGIHESPRHKSGLALRFPRMARWRQDKPVQEANTLDDLRAILAQYG